MWDNSVINLEEAMTRVLGHKDMYIRWLDEFFQPETFNYVNSAFEERDHTRAHWAIHKIKGTAGNLAITNLFKSAMELDERVKRNDDFDAMTHDKEALYAIFEAAGKMFRENEDAIEEYPV